MLWHDESGPEIGGRHGTIDRRSGDRFARAARVAGTVGSVLELRRISNEQILGSRETVRPTVFFSQSVTLWATNGLVNPLAIERPTFPRPSKCLVH